MSQECEVPHIDVVYRNRQFFVFTGRKGEGMLGGGWIPFFYSRDGLSCPVRFSKPVCPEFIVMAGLVPAMVVNPVMEQ